MRSQSAFSKIGVVPVRQILVGILLKPQPPHTRQKYEQKYGPPSKRVSQRYLRDTPIPCENKAKRVRYPPLRYFQNSSRGSQAEGHYPRKPSENPADPRWTAEFALFCNIWCLILSRFFVHSFALYVGGGGGGHWRISDLGPPDKQRRAI